MFTCKRFCSLLILLLLLLAGCSRAPDSEQKLFSSLALLPGAHMALAEPAPAGFKVVPWERVVSVRENGGAVWLFLPQTEPPAQIAGWLQENEAISFVGDDGVVYFVPAPGVDILPQLQAKHLEAELDPQSLARLWVIHGDVLKSGGNLDEAIDAYTQAITLDPQLVSAHLALGMALRERGDMNAARKAFENVVLLDPDNYQALRGIGDIYLFDFRKPMLAVEPLTRAYLLQPDNQGVLALVALALVESGQKDIALQVLNEAEAKATDEAQLRTINDIRQAYFSDSSSQ